jgi:hypothetical protein
MAVKVCIFVVRITRTDNGVRMAVKVCIFVVRITRTDNGVRMAVKICSPGTWVFLGGSLLPQYE